MIKTTIVLAAAAAVTVSGYAAYPDFCGPAELNKFAPLVITNGLDLLQCQSASGWTFIPPSAEPTVTQEIKMCKNDGCKKLLAAVQAKTPTDCFLSLQNTTDGVNVKKLVEQFEPFCALFGNFTTA